ncbi:hypothetical protein [Streptomyces sp. ITFR-16]|uniref:hypothetical protein n=1 Tax=Streptomyces sp. ITFR-16 TaxID=3075198 RepID=UPI00288C4F86|nr:hypothetical protein [Streptomyces sp. ITFR-16]WNI24308.1 hypothetical protein RLT58_21435 [Streptomyces sp. ITFR-16]
MAVGTAAIAFIAVSGTAAQAAQTGSGKAYGGCTNSVTLWRTGGTVYANAKMTCKKKGLILRPTVALSGNNGKTFKSDGKACRKATTCTTPTVSVKATKGWTYRASNSGNATLAILGVDDEFWPISSVAHTTYKAKS